MNKAFTKLVWQDLPSTQTALEAQNLNRLENGVDAIDNRVVTLDTVKANQSDLLQSLKTVSYNASTGVFTFTFWNGNTVIADLNIEKVPVSFTLSPQGILTMTTADGTQFTCDISTLIKTYSFVDSDTIDFTDTVDSSGNHTLTADIKDGSITADKLEPNYLAQVETARDSALGYASNAQTSAQNSANKALVSEGWAKGTQNGEEVTSESPYYHNNAEYFKDLAEGAIAGVSSFNGRSGAVVPQTGDYTKAMVGLANVDNTADADKNVATAGRAVIAEKDENGNVITSYYINTSNIGQQSVASATNATNATNATKATQDANGNNIVNTYQTKSGAITTDNIGQQTVDTSNKTKGVSLPAHTTGYTKTEKIYVDGGTYGLYGTTDSVLFLKALIKDLCALYPNKTQVVFEGTCRPSTWAFFQALIYDTSDLDADGYPRYAFAFMPQISNKIEMVTFLDFAFTSKTLS